MNDFLENDIYRFIPVGIAIADKDGNFLESNNVMREIYKDDQKDLKNISQIRILNNILNSEKKERTIRLGKNKEKTYNINIIELNNLYFIIVVDTSIFTDKYHLLNLSTFNISNNHLSIMWLEPDGKIMYANKTIEKLTGRFPIVRKYVYDIIPEIKKSTWNNLWKELENKGEIVYNHDYYSKKEDKLYRFKVLFHKFRYYNYDYCQMVMTDVTELFNLNLRLSLEKRKAEESEKLKNAFLSNISHEIRTPMNSIVGFSQVLHDQVDYPLNAYTKIILQNVDYLLSIIDNIITISRIESEEIQTKNENVSLLNILKDIKIIYSHKIKEHEKNIRLVLDNRKDFIIKSDKFILEEILHSIVDNAVKFTCNGIINIGFKIHNDTVEIYVKDTGIGIQNKYQEIIFDRFKQIDKVTTGSGLGLAIFKSYVEVLKGTYDLKSSVGEGTEISFTIKK